MGHFPRVEWLIRETVERRRLVVRIHTLVHSPVVNHQPIEESAMLDLAYTLLAAAHLRAPRNATMLFTLVALSGVPGACSTASTAPAAVRTYGPAQSLGQGTARTFVTRDASGRATALGVAMSEAAMTGLPLTPMPGMPSAAMLVLQLPAQVDGLGYDHVMLDWNPAGHEPNHVYTLPHFDFHFYQITAAEREAIVPTNPRWAEKSAIFPAADFVPNGYVAASVLGNVPPAAAAVPYMGVHWLDVASPELQPPPAGKAFTSTFLYGTWDGRFIFVEPMITKAFIESMKDKGDGVRFTVGTARKVARPGSYPTGYAIKYDAKTREYQITLEGLEQKQ